MKNYVYTIFLILAVIVLTLSCGETENFDALAKDGMAAYQQADYNEAIFKFGKGLHLRPSDRDMLFNIGLAFFKLNLLDSSLVYLHRANILYPVDYAINKELFRLCTLTEDYECALSAVQMMIANGDNDEMFWIPLADLNFFTGNYKLAKKYYQLLINDNPREGRYYWNLSECFSRQNKSHEAIRVLKEAVALLGSNPSAFTQIAANYVVLKEYAQAENYFRQAIKVEPKNVSLWVNLAHSLNEQKNREKKEEALAIYKLYYIDTPEIFRLDSLIKTLEKELGQN
jgi:tetratricopeptide (TPR) repeat protein